MRTISSLLVANRGEIAVRIIRACQELGIKTILAASETDRESMPALLADRVVCIGPPKAVGTNCYLEYLVPPSYDSLLAKVISLGHDRQEAIERMQSALGGFFVTGLETTIPFHRFILDNKDFREGKIHTRWLEGTLLEEYEQHERN
jgi:acetyl/propionyl-CoA carboxylase alpha subunit